MMIPFLMMALTLLSAECAADAFLPRALVLKPSSGKTFPSDSDFHIALHEDHTAVIWVAQSEGLRDNFLCGAVCALDLDDTDLQSIIDSKCKMISTWASSPRKGDLTPLASIPHRQIDWEMISVEAPEEKWAIAGVHKRHDVPVNYMIKKGNQTLWISKEKALELSLEGKLETIIP